MSLPGWNLWPVVLETMDHKPTGSAQPQRDGSARPVRSFSTLAPAAGGNTTGATAHGDHRFGFLILFHGHTRFTYKTILFGEHSSGSSCAFLCGWTWIIRRIVQTGWKCGMTMVNLLGGVGLRP